MRSKGRVRRDSKEGRMFVSNQTSKQEKRRTIYFLKWLKVCLFPSPSFEISVLVELGLFWIVITHAEHQQHCTAGQSRGAVRRQEASWSAHRLSAFHPLLSTVSVIQSDANAVSSKHISSSCRQDCNSS